MVNIDPRLIMENKDITKGSLQNSKIVIRKQEKYLSKEPIQEQKEESDTYLTKKNDLFHIDTGNKDPIFQEYAQHLKTFNPNSKVTKEIQPEKKSIKQVIFTGKGSEITKNKNSINSKPKNFANIITQDFMKNYPQENKTGSPNPILFSTNPKRENPPTPHHHSDKKNSN
ncbi:hypothetical protein O181_089967 [Austropuccinia psidii MF-1]|uniref:Uncharacterized protein n=1 Tax=Austropuccinia psidii MF-1 TaxID=1389203 RepID=A0A9Q3P785_9BASI|nr:hypothetical protein [Austropuccinia psidii MF-1]